ncbi:uridine phosphorylase [Salinadaptatus halalkaliphilus]|uniref:Uridine phosphorylase n=1 Tax=Salinadaptatus halalkaliphilus TaxID=2419781 RepID=A0A4S3TQ30_9EURY|nr:nucleoside phosphorylase [Salinadaptatus halalkaliphilus]THE64678.1 uridine phosphorylase [Salinadaptatus halalkaliphilus]
MTEESPVDSPLLGAKAYDEPSVFTSDSLVREARRQKDLPEEPVPEICALDPDGDLVRYLRETGQAERDSNWPGYHTDLYRFELGGQEIGLVGCAVGASFAVLVAEQLFTAGCEFLVSITSSGRIVPQDDPPYFVLIERALRDEGTSHHYAEPEPYATLKADLLESVESACESAVSTPVYTGATWTTDAPFRETETAIERARSEGILAVEMEAAALYTFANVREYPVVCFAYVTNDMGQGEEEFEKGIANGSEAALEVIDAAADAWYCDAAR